MGLQNEFAWELAKRVLETTQDLESMRELSLNILEQCKSQRQLLEMWMGNSVNNPFQDLESRRGE